MSGYNYQSDDDDLDEEIGVGNGGGGLRKQLEEALELNRKLAERLNAQDREKDLAAALKDKGINPALAAIVPKDADPKQWAEQYASLTGVQTPPADKTADEGSDNGNEQGKVPNEPEARIVYDERAERERQAMATMQQAQESGVPSEDILNSQMEQLKAVKSKEDLLALIQAEQQKQADQASQLF